MKLLNTHQAAQVLNEPEGTLRYWRCAGKGPAYIKLAGRVRYDEADVIAYVNANKRIPSVRATLDKSKLIFTECPLAVYDPTTLYDGVTVSSAPWGDCTGVKKLPVVFTVNGKAIKNKAVYDVHLYANSVDDYNRIFGFSSSPLAIKDMNESFGFLVSRNIAPVWDGESGTGFQENPDDEDWANMLVKYLNGELGGQGGPTFSGSQQGMGIAWMSWSTQFTEKGSDDLGILNKDGTRIEKELRIVRPLLFYPRPKGPSTVSAVPAHLKAK